MRRSVFESPHQTLIRRNGHLTEATWEEAMQLIVQQNRLLYFRTTFFRKNITH
jgi:predicted molibdopterin-dependent oxidoreductase YjgC